MVLDFKVDLGEHSVKILRLELFGFKSFKDKTIIHFDQPITAVVGSNGCGKSNVVDALFWVMGDMSAKHLRGNSMVDVIFSGTKDVAALDMAEVSLVLQREPGKDPPLPKHLESSHEIQVTRRYYRSSESEYLLNKKICRLRDVQEFFMDTGLGAKAYSIIEQGYITRMVTQKPEERRRVIEEVAGIIKFKARRAETLRKIEATQNNLQRVDDIVKAVQKELNSLKRQADKAEKYQSFSTELKEIELRVAAREWQDRSQSSTESAQLGAELRNKLSTLEEELQLEKNSLENSKVQLSKQEQEYDQARDLGRNLELELKDIESEEKNHHTKLENIKQRLDSNQQEAYKIQNRHHEIEEQSKAWQKELEGQLAQNSSLQENYQTKKKDYDTLKVELNEQQKQLDENRSKLHKLDIEFTKSTEQIQSKQNSIRSFHDKINQLQNHLGETGNSLGSKNSERQSTLGTLQQAFSAREDLEKEKNRIQDELTSIEGDLDKEQKTRDELRADYTQAKIQREHLQALHDQFEGVDAASKALALTLREKGQEGRLLADHIRVPSEYQKSFDAIFANSLDRVVVESNEELIELEEALQRSEDSSTRQSRAGLWLKDFSQSRAVHKTQTQDWDERFVTVEKEVPGLLGTSIQKQNISLKEYLNESPLVLGKLDHLLKEKMPEAAQQLWAQNLDNYLLVKDRKDFRAICQTLNYDLPFNLVSLGGDVLNQNGFLDLAPIEESTDHVNANILHRKEAIRQLAVDEKENKTKLDEAESKVEGLQQRYANSKNQFRELTAKLSALNPDVEKYTVFLGQVEADLARLHEKQSLYRVEEESLKSRIQENNQDISSLERSFREQQEEKQSLESNLLNSENEVENNRANFNELETVIEKYSHELREGEKTLSNKQQELATLKQEADMSKQRLLFIEKENTSLSEEVKASLQLINQTQEKLQHKSEELAAHQKQEEEFKNALEEIKKDFVTFQTQVEQFQNELQSLNKRLNDIEQSSAVNEVELKNIAGRMQEIYNIDFRNIESDKLQEFCAPGDIEEFSDPESAKQRVIELKKKIDKLGKINMVAMEDFQDKSYRHEYLFVQRQDIKDSLSQLSEALDKINTESVTRFEEAFHAVNNAFQTTFPAMFGGGNAELRLTNPDDLLESGVEIVAQPPGKKLQSITLLSGGEKALTAVSLIFGIFSIKPSPFAVLDEVDAPLDDANVGRFNTQIRLMAKTSQIILITHKKKTMENCDALFGVTMQKAGISKVASAKLGELDYDGIQ